MMSRFTLAREPRAYLLIEVMLAGAMCAVIIAGLMTQLAAVRKKNAFTTRDLTAAQLVLERVEERRHAAAASFPPTNVGPETITALDGSYTRTAAVNSTGCPESITHPASGTITLQCRNVVVTVTYNADDPTTAPIEQRSSTATTRVYAP